MTGSTQRFTDRVENYQRYRPGYPAELLDYLLETCHLDQTSSIADIGSGTGIFSGYLLDRQLSVAAVEPNAEMRKAAERLLSDHDSLRSISGTAEATSLAEHSVDLITVAQAFHWFDQDAAMTEFKRILKPQGQLALIWNRRDLHDPFQQAYEKMLLRLAPDYNVVNHMNIRDEQIQAWFDDEDYQQKSFRYTQYFNCEAFLGRMQSSSYSPAKGTIDLSELNQAAIALFEKFSVDGKLSFLYNCHLYLGQPRN